MSVARRHQGVQGAQQFLRGCLLPLPLPLPAPARPAPTGMRKHAPPTPPTWTDLAAHHPSTAAVTRACCHAPHPHSFKFLF